MCVLGVAARPGGWGRGGSRPDSASCGQEWRADPCVYVFGVTRGQSWRAGMLAAPWPPTGHPPPLPQTGLTSGAGAGRKCLADKRGGCQAVYSTRTWEDTPPPPLPRPSWGFKKHVGGNERLQFPQRRWEQARNKANLICLGSCFDPLPVGLGKELLDQIWPLPPSLGVSSLRTGGRGRLPYSFEPLGCTALPN